MATSLAPRTTDEQEDPLTALERKLGQRQGAEADALALDPLAALEQKVRGRAAAPLPSHVGVSPLTGDVDLRDPVVTRAAGAPLSKSHAPFRMAPVVVSQPPAETTILPPVEEAQFQAWARANRIADVDAPESHYDYRGFWKAGGRDRAANGHFPDTFKQHGHPTFSVESQYSGGPSDGGRWEGARFIPQPVDGAVPVPSPAVAAPSRAGPVVASRDATATRDPREPAYRPGVVERGGRQLLDFAEQAREHPGEVAASLITAPVKSAFNAVVAPSVGEVRPNPNRSKGGNSARLTPEQLAQPYDAEHGAVTPGERAAAVAQTMANIAFPGIESVVVERAAAAGMGKVGSKLAGMAVAGAPAGAAYSPDDPAAGAIAGSVISTVLGAAHEGAGRVGGMARVAKDVAATGGRAIAERVASLRPEPVDPLAALEEKMARGVTAPASAPTLRRRAAEWVDPSIATERGSLQRAAETDALTGLANRAALDRALPAAEADPATRVILFDANNFGKVNKAIGHAAGDGVLTDMSAALHRAATEHGIPSDAVYRKGGDEFVIVAPAHVADAVKARAETLFGDRVVTNPTTGREVTVSVSGTHGNTLAEADATLQEAKQARKASQAPATSPALAEAMGEAAGGARSADSRNAITRSELPVIADTHSPTPAGDLTPEFRDVIKMTPDDLAQHAEQATAADQTIEADLFGTEGAKRYKSLQRRANSSTASNEQADAASAEIGRMEDALTEAQRNRLYGIGQYGLNAEELRAAASAARDYAAPNVDIWSDADLRSTVARELTTGRPHQDAVSALRLRGAVEELQRRTGEPLEQIMREGVIERGRRGHLSSGAQAEELFRARIRELHDAGLFEAGDPTPVPAGVPASRLLAPGADHPSPRAGVALTDATAMDASDVAAETGAPRIVDRAALESPAAGPPRDPLAALEQRHGVTADSPAIASASEGRGPDALYAPINHPPSPLGAKLRKLASNPPPGQIMRVTSLRKISEALAEGVGVPLREGRFRAAQRQAAGVFFPQSEVARVVRMDKIDTAAHEIGHYVSKEYLHNPTMQGAPGRGAPTLPLPAARELVKMGRDLYGSRAPKGGFAEEGIAQWARFYVTEPHRLATDAPVFSQWMEQHVFAKEPALQQVLDAARQAHEDHVNAPATARVDAMLSVNDQSKLAAGLRNITTPARRSWLARKLVTWGLDDLGEFKRAVAELGGADSPTKDAYVLARLTRGAAGAAEEMLARGIVDPRTGARVAPAVEEVLASLKPEELQPFRRYLAAERALELAGRGVDAGIALPDAQEMVRLYEPQFRAKAEQLWQISHALIDYRVAKGLLTPEEGFRIQEANQRRVGFYRVFEDTEAAGGGQGTGKGYGRNSSGMQRAVGSSRDIIDPLESIITDVYKTVQQAHTHEAALTLYRHALATEGGGRIAELVPAPQVPVEIPVERVRQQLQDLGFTVPNGGVGQLAGVLRSFQDAAQAGAREAKDLVLPVIIDGERKWLAIKDAQLFDAIKGVDRQQLPMWLRIVGAPTRLLRAGATLTGEFVARNPVKDAFTAAAYSRGPTRPPGYLATEGLFHLIKRDDLYQRWRLAGGDNVAQLGLDRGQVQKNLAQLTRSTTGKIADVVLHPIDLLRMVSGLMENATRVGEFAAVERQGRAAGLGRADADAAAAFAARDVTVDFAKAGQIAKYANQLMSFFNANVQGGAKLAAELRARPQVVLPRIAAMITLPSVALYLLQRDDPAYQEVPQWQKDLAWIIVQRDAHGALQHIWRVPKPPELGILFGTTFERALQFIDHHDPEALTGLASSLAATLNPAHVPDAMRPLLEWWANKNFFTGRPIVPTGMEKLPESEQSTRRTGEAARVLGRITNSSPAKIENTVASAAGGLGVYGLQAADAAVRAERKLTGQPPLPGGEAHIGDATTRMPVVRGFAVREPGSDAESVARTLQEYHAAEAHRLAWKRKLKEGDGRGAATYLAAHRDAIASVATSEDTGGAPGTLKAVYALLTHLQQQSAEISAKVRDPERAAALLHRIADQQVSIARRYRAALEARRAAAP